MAGFWPFGKQRLTVKAHQGERGRWRWEARNEDGAVVAVSAVRGFDTELAAKEAARKVGASAFDVQ